MRIEITNHFTNSGREYYRFDLWDGPDGIEHVSGFSTDLIESFSKILEWQQKIAHEYLTQE